MEIRRFYTLKQTIGQDLACWNIVLGALYSWETCLWFLLFFFLLSLWTLLGIVHFVWVTWFSEHTSRWHWAQFDLCLEVSQWKHLQIPCPHPSCRASHLLFWYWSWYLGLQTLFFVVFWITQISLRWEGVRLSFMVAVTLKNQFIQMCLKELFAKLKTEIPLAFR